MVARSLARRMEELEQKVSGRNAWHVIVQHAGQTEEEAFAAYETASGPIEPDDRRILRVVIRKPNPIPTSCCAD